MAGEFFRGGVTMIDPWMDSVVRGVGADWSPFTSAISRGVTVGNGFINFDPTSIYQSGYALGGFGLMGGIGGALGAGLGGGFGGMGLIGDNGFPPWMLLFMDPDMIRTMFGMGGNNNNTAGNCGGASNATPAAAPAAPTTPQAAPAAPPTAPGADPKPTDSATAPPDGNAPATPPKVRRQWRRGPGPTNPIKNWTKDQKAALQDGESLTTELNKMIGGAPGVFAAKFTLGKFAPQAGGVVQATLSVKEKTSPTKQDVDAVLNYFNSHSTMGALTVRIVPDEQVKALRDGTAAPPTQPNAPPPTAPPTSEPNLAAANQQRARDYAKSHSSSTVKIVELPPNSGRFSVSYQTSNPAALATAGNDVAQLKKIVGPTNVIGPTPF